jgi:hypothetical protein
MATKPRPRCDRSNRVPELMPPHLRPEGVQKTVDRYTALSPSAPSRDSRLQIPVSLRSPPHRDGGCLGSGGVPPHTPAQPAWMSAHPAAAGAALADEASSPPSPLQDTDTLQARGLDTPPAGVCPPHRAAYRASRPRGLARWATPVGALCVLHLAFPGTHPASVGTAATSRHAL